MSAKILAFPAGPLPEALGVPVAPTLPVRRPKAPKPPAEPLPLARPPRALSETELRLQKRILDGYFIGRRGAQGHVAAGVARDRGHVEEFLAYVGQPLWACTTDDFESWAGQLALVRHLRPSSQRTMHCALASFFDYASDHPAWQNEVHSTFDARIVRVVTRENRIVHVCDNVATVPRRYLVADELNQVFGVLAQVVEVAAFEAPRMLKTFQRDRAMFYAFYAFGLRLAEGHGLDVHSFSPNPDLPELGRFGCVGVFHGKGSNGSGPKFRTVPALLPDVRPMLDWYLEDIRPLFRRRNPNDTAMWLSEQGRRLGRSTIAVRYKRLISMCGLDPKLFSPHGLRHMHVSHQAAANVPTLFTSRMVGHVDTAITARYTHLGDDYARNVAFNYVHASMAALRKDP